MALRKWSWWTWPQIFLTFKSCYLRRAGIFWPVRPSRGLTFCPRIGHPPRPPWKKERHVEIRINPSCFRFHNFDISFHPSFSLDISSLLPSLIPAFKSFVASCLPILPAIPSIAILSFTIIPWLSYFFLSCPLFPFVPYHILPFLLFPILSFLILSFLILSFPILIYPILTFHILPFHPILPSYPSFVLIYSSFSIPSSPILFPSYNAFLPYLFPLLSFLILSHPFFPFQSFPSYPTFPILSYCILSFLSFFPILWSLSLPG